MSIEHEYFCDYVNRSTRHFTLQAFAYL